MGRGKGKKRAPYVRPQYGAGPGGVDPSACENAALLRYYREQRIVPPGEWAAFERSLRTSLPMALRILQSRPGWRSTVAELQRRGEVSPLGWCPGAEPLAWQCASEAYRGELRRWCQQQNSVGTVSFQEAVSMLPALLLDPSPAHLTLDMCAAPGSKTTQLLDTITAQDDWGAEPTLATGLLVAADLSSLKVTSVVAGRLRKIHSPILALAVANSKNFPFVSRFGQGQDSALLFDRILCDVPCSGDGTIRKNPSIWRSWRLGYSLGLHATQLKLLRRGLRLLKPGDPDSFTRF